MNTLAAPPIRVELWADFTDPASYVTESALAGWAAEGRVELIPRAAELFPAPIPLPVAPAEVLAAWAQVARAEGLPFQPPDTTPRTRKAHEAADFARDQGVGAEMRAAILGAYWGEARDIGRIDVLVELGAALGLDPTQLRVVLDIDAHTGSVLADGEAGAARGIRTVPSLVVGAEPATTLIAGPQTRASLAGLLGLGGSPPAASL